MARFYAKFDSGSAGWVSALDTTGSSTGFFERRRIALDSASAAPYRDGLIISRSALSTDSMADIPPSYRDGSLGTIVPADLYTTDYATYASWSAVYTSSVNTPPGVIIPADYRTRPTASILSTNGTIGGATASVGVSYIAYASLSLAVRQVLDIIQDGGANLNSPYTRLGSNPSRTIHSIWHDQDLQYFGWDDFTPGTPQNFTFTFPQASAGKVYIEDSEDLSIVFTWTPEFQADRAGDVPINATTYRDDNATLIDTLATTVTNGNTFYSWSVSAGNYGDNGSDPYSYKYDVNSDIKFRDATITSHESSLVTNDVDKAVEIFKVSPLTNVYTSGPGGTLQQLCDDISPGVLYMNGAISNFSAASYIWSNKNGNAAPAGYYAQAGDTVARNWDGGQFLADASPLPCTTCCAGSGGSGSGGGGGCGAACTGDGDCAGICPTCVSGTCQGENQE